MKATIYVYLRDEGIDVWRPVAAERIRDDVYRITDASPNDTESWEFSTGDTVRCNEKTFSDGKRGLVAFEKVAI